VVSAFRCLVEHEYPMAPDVFAKHKLGTNQSFFGQFKPLIKITLRFSLLLPRRQRLRLSEGMPRLFVKNDAIPRNIDEERPATGELIVDIGKIMDDRNNRRFDPAAELLFQQLVVDVFP